MAYVFISYASEDRQYARAIAELLENMGCSVWWDRNLLAGQDFSQTIESELYSARCVVVLWSRSSVSSHWVKNEATVGRERGVLVPARIDPVELPLQFRDMHAANLVGWNGQILGADGNVNEEFRNFVMGVARITSRQP